MRKEAHPDSAMESRPGPGMIEGLALLAAGSLLEGGGWLKTRLEEAPVPPPAGDNHTDGAPEDAHAVDVVVGLLAETARLAGRNVGRIGRLAGAAAHLTTAPLRGAANLPVFSPLRAGLDKLEKRGQDKLAAWAKIGRAEQARSRQIARALLESSVESGAARLSENPGVSSLVSNQLEKFHSDPAIQAQLETLVQNLAGEYILYLQRHPQVLENLVHAQANIYLDHLQENPEQVQVLVQGQSANLASEVKDEVRSKMVTADNLFESMLRSLLRRTHRDDLPEPSPEVQARAFERYQPSPPVELDEDLEHLVD